jgi:hypothetical protein
VATAIQAAAAARQSSAAIRRVVACAPPGTRESPEVIVAMLTPEPPARSRALAILATVATAVLLLVPAPPTPPLAPGLAALPLDRLVHAGLFLLLVRLWRRGSLLPAAALAGIAAAYGGLLELAQAGLGTRSGEWGDFVADVAGAVVGALLPAARRATAFDKRPPLA